MSFETGAIPANHASVGIVGRLCARLPSLAAGALLGAYPKITHAEGLRLKKRYHSFAEAFQALEEASKEVDRWIQPISCSTTGGDDDDQALKGRLLANDGADDRAQNEPDPTAGMGYDCFDNRRYQYAPHVRNHERHSRTIDQLVDEGAKRDARRLKEVGRRQYALELVLRLNKRFAAQADEAQYRYGPEASNRDYIRRVQLRVAPKRRFAEITQTRDNMIANLGNDFDRAREKEAA